MTRFLESTVGRLAVFWVDLICGLTAKAFYYIADEDD